LPNNYVQVYVENEIISNPDAEGIVGIEIWLCYPWFCHADIGDNHLGYIGFRDNENVSRLLDDGAMNVVVSEGKNK
jgi:hypothetical protein